MSTSAGENVLFIKDESAVGIIDNSGDSHKIKNPNFRPGFEVY